jgi:DNA-binding NtrC family response regulator
MAELLVVDDDDFIVDALDALLTLEGHAVRVAHNGMEALQALDRGLVDAILLDVEMPQLDGPHTAHELFLQDVGREKIPVILVSGRLDLQRIAALIGTPYFLPKPCAAEPLLATIAQALVERRAPAPPTTEHA